MTEEREVEARRKRKATGQQGDEAKVRTGVETRSGGREGPGNGQMSLVNPRQGLLCGATQRHAEKPRAVGLNCAPCNENSEKFKL